MSEFDFPEPLREARLATGHVVRVYDRHRSRYPGHVHYYVDAQLLSEGGVELNVVRDVGIPPQQRVDSYAALVACLGWLLAVPGEDDNEAQTAFLATADAQALFLVYDRLTWMAEDASYCEPDWPSWFCTAHADHDWLSCRRCLERFEQLPPPGRGEERISFLISNPGFDRGADGGDREEGDDDR